MEYIPYILTYKETQGRTFSAKTLSRVYSYNESRWDMSAYGLCAGFVADELRG